MNLPKLSTPRVRLVDYFESLISFQLCFFFCSVLNQFGRNKELSEELKNVCLQIVAISVSCSKDNQGN